MQQKATRFFQDRFASTLKLRRRVCAEEFALKSLRCSLRLRIARLHDFIEIFLEVSHVIGDKTECMMERKPLDIGGILGKIIALTIEFGEDWFDLHISGGYYAALEVPATPSRVTMKKSLVIG